MGNVLSQVRVELGGGLACRSGWRNVVIDGAMRNPGRQNSLPRQQLLYI
jgi:hypothetical protein